MASLAKGWASYTVYRPYSTVESVDWTQPIYFPSPSDIFGRVHMGAAILPFIQTTAYSTPLVRRWFIWDAFYFTFWSLYIDHRHDTPTYSPFSTYF